MDESEIILIQDTYCIGCGNKECPGCKRELDPPRFCEKCGKKLTVKISPTDAVISCKVHGIINC